ncbi:Ubiquinol-cytochrome-c reductase complex assembly factor 3 [Camelus dromedarius]|uniref:Ubiquinol-cytochrome-c reductase complex assembly factor 3 n=1 Tax=Camelus dromedarius TaxID=9838 RepID=A0A5N4DNT3_CAMDR|nr:Ubiquinol-cytochrome-c reductase complex assembly factor 3 [Camelus dromedarius]
MGTLRKVLIAGAVLGAGAGVGSALFVLVTPGEQQKQAMLKVGVIGKRRWGGGVENRGLGTRTANLPSGPQEMPVQDPQRRDEAARTKQLLLATLQEAAATQENVAWRKNWMSPGGGRSA